MSRQARRGQRRRLGHKTAQQQAWQAPINRLLKAKQYDEAKQQLQQLLAQYPNNAAMHLQLAHVYYQLEQYPLAIKHYQQAQELGASGRNLHIQLANCYIKQQNYRAALPHTEALLQANDKDVDALILHAGALFPSGEPQAALEHYQRALQLDPQRPDIYVGMARIKNFKPDSAVFKLLQNALTKTDDPRTQANYLATLGKAYLDIGDDEQAFAHYQQANNGFLLIGLAPYLQRGVGFDISHSCVQIGQAVAQHLGHEHIHLQQSTFDKFKNQDRFDLIIACAVHHWIGLPIEELADQLQRWCADEGLLLLESQGRRSIYRTEPDFEQKVQAIAAKGFEIVRRGSLCDDGLNYRAFVILRKHPTTEN